MQGSERYGPPRVFRDYASIRYSIQLIVHEHCRLADLRKETVVDTFAQVGEAWPCRCFDADLLSMPMR